MDIDLCKSQTLHYAEIIMLRLSVFFSLYMALITFVSQLCLIFSSLLLKSCNNLINTQL